MFEFNIDQARLTQFESELDPQNLEHSPIPVTVMGFGEISTVLDIEIGAQNELAYKRMPLFHTEEEIEQYTELYNAYTKTLQDTIGVDLVPAQLVKIKDEKRNRVAVYIVQQKLPVDSIGHKAIRHLPPGEIDRLMLAVLTQINNVFQFNQENGSGIALGIDGQISNWSVLGFDPVSGKLPEEINLLYIDTSTPLMSVGGAEQLNPELFLRSAPSFLVWILKLFFLEDVLTRYYDARKVSIDLIANFYKEQRPELIPELVTLANQFYAAQIKTGDFEPLTIKEIKAYYQEDALIWRLYLAFRKVDRTLHRLIGKHYPYILPGKTKR